MKSILVTLSEIRAGRVVAEGTDQLAAALAAVRSHHKAASVTIRIDIKPVDSAGMVEPAIHVSAEVVSKLPKPEPEGTLMFIGEDNSTTLHPTRAQPDLPGVTVLQQPHGERA